MKREGQAQYDWPKVQVTLPREEMDELLVIAGQNERTLTQHCRWILRQYLRDHT